jgi:hypothetical protein
VNECPQSSREWLSFHRLHLLSTWVGLRGLPVEDWRIENLRVVQLLLGHPKLGSAVRILESNRKRTIELRNSERPLSSGERSSRHRPRMFRFIRYSPVRYSLAASSHRRRADVG